MNCVKFDNSHLGITCVALFLTVIAVFIHLDLDLVVMATHVSADLGCHGRL